MNSRKSVWSVALVLMFATVAAAQVPSHIAIESGNGGSVIAPTNPNGLLNVGAGEEETHPAQIFLALRNGRRKPGTIAPAA